MEIIEKLKRDKIEVFPTLRGPEIIIISSLSETFPVLNSMDDICPSPVALKLIINLISYLSMVAT